MVWLGGTQRGFYLGERFAVSRWLRDGVPRDGLAPIGATLVAPTDAGLDPTPERTALRELFGTPPVELRELAEVQTRLSDGPGFGVLHFSCHGGAVNASPEGAKLSLQRQQLLRPIHVWSREHTAALSGSLVFINACHAGLPGWNLAGHGSWAEAFTRAGAGATVATSWAVDDTAAASFAETFYRQAGDGATLAEAVRRARLRIRTEGEPTRLAYALYASRGAHLTIGGTDARTAPAHRVRVPLPLGR